MDLNPAPSAWFLRSFQNLVSHPVMSTFKIYCAYVSNYQKYGLLWYSKLRNIDHKKDEKVETLLHNIITMQVETKWE